MLFYDHRRKSVLCGFIGTMLTLIGVVGLLCYSYSKSTQRLDGYIIADADVVKRAVKRHGKVCVLSNIYCDDNLYLPDTGERVVKGNVTLSLRWPDGSESMLLNWHGAASYLKAVAGDTSLAASIPPECVECISTDEVNPKNARLAVEGNRITVDYCGRSYSVGGRAVRGTPQLMLHREYLFYGSRVAVIIEKAATDYYAGSGYKVSRITAYESASARRSGITGTSIAFILMIAAGIGLFFVPEPKFRG